MKLFFIAAFCLFQLIGSAQEFDKTASIGLSAGLVNYQGDLQPNSFTFKQSNAYLSIFGVKPLLNRVNLRFGGSIGAVEAADKHNRGYLVPRNLSFKSGIKELYAGVEVFLLNRQKMKLTPYVFAGVALFHFNPWTRDVQGDKVYLQPLSTEGQGLTAYPDRKVYTLTQYALCFAGGFKYTISPDVTLGWEISQRKTFTDHLDDVSASYVDGAKLLAAKGSLAAALAYRGDELPGGQAQPKEGEQRGTPTENDWYYYSGLTMEVKLSAVQEKAARLFRRNASRRYERCPTRF
jgi:hypothetical protein